ncbi:MAG: hypothetical protein KatS3mg119_1310 [Rhodothalassiaceae bacterium]|nr:MAG: hypothetical protein KatS3mg119_1310 [Rhodothalassiaceae bacterium]
MQRQGTFGWASRRAGRRMRPRGVIAAAAGLSLAAAAADAGTTYYHYDGLGRLVSVCDAASGKRIRYSYDANGNRTSWTVTTASCSANAAPVAVNDTVNGYFLVGTIPQGGNPAFVTPLDNDTDPDGDEIRITGASCMQLGVHSFRLRRLAS